MSNIGEYGLGSGNSRLAPPLFVECDRQGQVVWMNAAARAAFGEPSNLVDTIRSRSPQFSVVMETRKRLLVGAQLGAPANQTGRAEVLGLLDLEDHMVRHCFRLRDVERNLSARARRLRPSGGRRAILQMERERGRLGRDLHTGVGQLLVAIRTQLEIILTQLPSPSLPVQEALGRISSLLADALEQLRTLSRRIHPPEWLRLDLETAIAQLWQLSGIPARYEATLEQTPLPAEPDLEVKIFMYRVAQEALSNLTQHARATQVALSLEAAAGKLTLRVKDNGIGFDTGRLFSAPASVASGIGLRSIREQAASLGGRLVVESGSEGTLLEVSVPFPAHPA